MKVLVTKQRCGGRAAFDFYDALVEVESIEAALLKGRFAVLARGRFFWQLGAERDQLELGPGSRLNREQRHALEAIGQAFPGLQALPGYTALRYQIRTDHQGPDQDEREIEFDHPIHRETAS